ncbi:EamA family transporter [Rheinheimera soli]|uniref:Carboxylate/amino acid/amine transporter n=1 Tax=Rheinheimera soli TaxID=443616 RepID=A0ABU1W1U3_9GAMM|nr:EamA family transporter [Rheinheimera soli]MDR7121765.1 carboxylate/amino acid/amine transporter [Rheinheimera soli]
MGLLWLVTLIWAFSFSLIGEFLAGRVDPYLAVSSRMLLALLLFLPWLFKSSSSKTQAVALAAIGSVQLGLMYLFLYHSFLYLTVAEVLLFTILTPVYISVLDYFWRYKKLHLRWLGPALLAILGALVIRYQNLSSDFWWGLLLIQAANLCFAFGQVAYRQLNLGSTGAQRYNFGWFFVGATVTSLIATALFADWNKMPTTTLDYGILAWLGVVASGLGYWLWNAGARQVNANQLAVMNNVLIPAGLVVNFVFWQHNVNWLTLSAGSVLILASLVWASRQKNL